MVVYHYSKIPDWKSIREGTRPGLFPGTKIAIGSSYDLPWKAIFALPEPTPDSWVKNTMFPRVWEQLRLHIGELLLEIRVTPRDYITVLDQANVLFAGQETRDELLEYAARYEEHERRYIMQRASLEDYFANPRAFSLPEILIFNGIPIDRIAISDHQPLIDEVLRTDGPGKERVIADLQADSELQYLISSRSSEGIIRGKEF